MDNANEMIESLLRLTKTKYELYQRLIKLETLGQQKSEEYENVWKNSTLCSESEDRICNVFENDFTMLKEALKIIKRKKIDNTILGKISFQGKDIDCYKRIRNYLRYLSECKGDHRKTYLLSQGITINNGEHYFEICREFDTYINPLINDRIRDTFTNIIDGLIITDKEKGKTLISNKYASLFINKHYENHFVYCPFGINDDSVYIPEYEEMLDNLCEEMQDGSNKNDYMFYRLKPAIIMLFNNIFISIKTGSNRKEIELKKVLFISMLSLLSEDYLDLVYNNLMSKICIYRDMSTEIHDLFLAANGMIRDRTKNYERRLV